MSGQVPELLKRKFGAFTLLAIATLACGLGNYLASDASSDDPQGGSNPWCIKSELPSIPNGTDMEVSGYRTDCDTLAKDSMVYVHLHRKGGRESRSTLIFRYDGNDPKIRWIDNNHVSIQVDGVSYVGKQVTFLYGTSASYELSMTDWSELDSFVKRLNKTGN